MLKVVPEDFTLKERKSAIPADSSEKQNVYFDTFHRYHQWVFRKCEHHIPFHGIKNIRDVPTVRKEIVTCHVSIKSIYQHLNILSEQKPGDSKNHLWVLMNAEVSLEQMGIEAYEWYIYNSLAYFFL